MANETPPANFDTKEITPRPETLKGNGTDYELALDAANDVAEEVAKHPERREQYESQVAHIIGKFGVEITNRNEIAKKALTKTIGDCSAASGEQFTGTKVNLRFGKIAENIERGLADHTITIDQASVMLALQIIESNAEKAKTECLTAGKDGASAIPRNMFDRKHE